MLLLIKVDIVVHHLINLPLLILPNLWVSIFWVETKIILFKYVKTFKESYQEFYNISHCMFSNLVHNVDE